MLRPLTSRISPFMDAIERWREEADSPSYIEAFISTPVRDLQTTQQPARVNMNNSILQAIECFKDSESIVVNKVVVDGNKVDIAELIFTRLVFLEHAVQAPNFLDSLASLADKIPSLGWVDDDDTLDVALQRMISTGFDLVGIMSGGMMTGVLHINDIFNFLQREVAVASQSEKNMPRFGTQSTFRSMEPQKNLRAERDLDKKEMSQLQLSAVEWCQSGWTECLLMCCILLDLICVFIEWETSSDDEEKLLVATGIILFVFVFEVIIRFVGRRWTVLTLPFETLDVSIVVVSALVYIIVLGLSNSGNSKTIVTVMRVLRLLRQIKIVRYIYRIYKSHRMRYCQDGFNLDISYITNSCIAFSQPVLVPHGSYVNTLKEIHRFFFSRYSGRYLIFNLCAEYSYDDDYFGGHAEKITIEQHNPPKIHQMVTFVEHAGRFLDEHPGACIAIHCSGGIARTGAMTAAWLLYSTFSDTAQDAVKWFMTRRTGSVDGSGGEALTPSQIRYVEYMEKTLQEGGYRTKRLVLSKLRIQTCPRMDSGGGSNLWFTIEEGEKEVYCSSVENMDSYSRMEKNQSELTFEIDVLLSSDIRITFYHQDITHGREQLCFFVCFHTGFIQSSLWIFEKTSVDVACNDTKHKIFDANFALILDFNDIPLPTEPDSADDSVIFGAFRKIFKPSKSITESAALMRCRDSSAQAKVAKRLQTKVGFHFGLDVGITATCFTKATELMQEEVEESKENLCSAAGSSVKHEVIDMFKAEDESVLTPFNATTLTKSSSMDALKPLKRSVQGIARSLVSGNKRRFLGEGFDLDLTYITPRLIAMGYPSTGLESNYRNSAEDVYRFFQERHAAHYLIVNLCSEREYDLDTFHRNCVRYPFDDHSPPALELILPCCACIHKFLQADENNVVAIHCKAGKGRTGLIVVSYLMYCGLKGNTRAARHLYDWARTKDGKGLTIISQIRYAHYFEQQLRYLKHGRELLHVAQNAAVAIKLVRFRLHTMPHWHSNRICSPNLSISIRSQVDHQVYEIFRSDTDRFDYNKQWDRCDIELGTGIRAAGDFLVAIYHQDRMKMCSFWLHSAMVLNPPSEMGGTFTQLSDVDCRAEKLPASTWSLTLSKHEIDTAAKDKRCNRFKATFKVEIFFSALEGETGTGQALEKASRQRKMDSSFRSEEAPLWQDKDAYQKVVQVALSIGQPCPSFQDYLLGRCQALCAFVTGSDKVKRNTNSAKRASFAGDDSCQPTTPTPNVGIVEADLGFATPDSKTSGVGFTGIERRPSSSAFVASWSTLHQHEFEDQSVMDPAACNPPASHDRHIVRVRSAANIDRVNSDNANNGNDGNDVGRRFSSSLLADPRVLSFQDSLPSEDVKVEQDGCGRGNSSNAANITSLPENVARDHRQDKVHMVLTMF